MPGALRYTAEVQPGHRIEISDPQLREGDQVDVIVVQADKHGTARSTMLDLTASLPIGPRSAATWAEVEQLLQQERDSWGV